MVLASRKLETIDVVFGLGLGPQKLSLALLFFALQQIMWSPVSIKQSLAVSLFTYLKTKSWSFVVR